MNIYSWGPALVIILSLYAAIYRYTRLWSGFYGSNRSQMWFYYVQIPSFLFNSFWARRTIDFNFFRRLLSSDRKNCRSEKFSIWKMLKIENAKKSPKSILATFEIFDFQHFQIDFFSKFFSSIFFSKFFLDSNKKNLFRSWDTFWGIASM